MEIKREQIADILFTAAIVVSGVLSGNAVVASVVGGIGINWAAGLTREGWNHARQRLLGKSGLLNHDLQQALARALRQAIAHLEQTWWQTPRGSQMRRTEPDVARQTAEAFKLLREDAAAFCTPDRLGRAAGNEQVCQILYGDEAIARHALASRLADYLHGHDPQLVAFVEAHLVGELAFWFGEELKADRPGSNRAWRAFQRLLLEGLQAGLAEMRAEQQEMTRALADLHAWAEGLEAPTPGMWERTAQAALERALTEARDQLLEAIARESGLTRAAIEAGVEQIAWLLRQELARLRLELLPRLQEHGLVEGAAPLPVDLRRHFDRLLRDYALFGGRAGELAAIQEFLAGPQGGYLFVTGPSGYGKTALLAQLARQDEAAYHFLNRAYGMADEDLFLRNLCQQLAARHGLGGRLPMATAELRVLCPALLRLPPADGRPVVVLVDGLDEALNWEPGPQHFPSDLPDGVKVIFSARQVAERDWPGHLRLPPERVRRLVLAAMTAEDLTALLRAAGGVAAALADDAAWIGQALQVSGGDPFYLKLLVEDVRDGRLSPGQIDAQLAGLDAYLKGWWEQVAAAVRKEQDARDLLGCLAAARGRLRRDDLVAMFPDLGWALDGVLAEVRRFVIGDEREGYALCHPRFADYVRRRVGSRTLQTYSDALLAYCAGWREHRSPYALAHYAGHLAEAGRWEELHTLAAAGDERQEWAEARHASEGSYAGYLSDLGLAWAHADEEGWTEPAAVGRQVRYALIESSIHSLVGNIPPELLVAWVEHGVWKPQIGLDYAQQIPDVGQRFKALSGLAPHLPEPLKGDVLQKASALAREVSEASAWGSSPRVEALASLLPDLPGPEHTQALQETLTVARRLRLPSYHVNALLKLVPYLEEPERTSVLKEAEFQAGLIDDEDHRARAMAELACHLPEPQRSEILARALKVAWEYFHPDYPDAGAEVAEYVKQIGEYARTRDLAEEASHLTGPERIRVLTKVLAATRTIEEERRADILARVCPYLPESLLTEALISLREIEYAGYRAKALIALATYLPDSLLDEALGMAREIPIKEYRAQAMAALASHLSADKYDHVLTELKEAIWQLGTLYYAADLFKGLAPLLPEKMLIDVLQEIRKVRDADECVKTLARLAPYLPELLLREALAAARDIRSEEQRAETLATIAHHLPEPERSQVLAESLAAARKIHSASDRADMLVELAPHLSESLLHEALVIAREFSSYYKEDCDRALAGLAP
jgi:hypothetical protein